MATHNELCANGRATSLRGDASASRAEIPVELITA
jgi:hypothetical protein